MRLLQFCLSAFVLLLCGFPCAMKTVADATIVESIESDSVVVINMPELLKARLINKTSGMAAQTEPQVKDKIVNNDANIAENTLPREAGTVKTAGYRVQVFSDNNVSTAKSEARTKAQALQARLPQYRTYVIYQSPYWRLKVGDFPTRTEAENAADEIKKIFPAYAREVRVVKDRINR